MAGSPHDWLAPGERMVVETTQAHLTSLEETRQEGRITEHRAARQTLAKTPRLVVTDARLVFLDKSGTPKYEVIYDLPYLRGYLPVLKRWNDKAEARVEEAQAGQSALHRWFDSGAYRSKFGVHDAVSMIEWVQRPKGILGPKHYLLMTEATFRPYTSEKEVALENERAYSKSRLQDAKIKAEELRLGALFTYRTVTLTFREVDRLDTVLAALAPKVQAVTEYVENSGGLQSDYSIPTAQIQGIAGYRPTDPNLPPPTP